MEIKTDIPNIAFEIMYDGSRFHGWQVQKNARSVQSAFQDALETILGFRPDVCGCSRTDAGVHANSYVCHISSQNVNISPERFPQALNSHLKNSGIAVKNAACVPGDFHARYSCTGKEYIYKIWNKRYSNPFLSDRALFYPIKTDFEKYAFLCEEFCGTHDFRAFMSKGSKNEENTVRTVKYFNISQSGDGCTVLRVCADGFLYNMVRIMTGTFLELCAKDAKPGDLSEIINSADRKNAGDTAPAHALYLNRIFYPDNIFDERT